MSAAPIFPPPRAPARNPNRLISTPTRSSWTPRGACRACPRASPAAPWNVPALALLLRPDGSVLARFEPDDMNNEVRKDIERNYNREIKDSNKKRENSMGSGYGGMMGSMMGGMMGGGYRRKGREPRRPRRGTLRFLRPPSPDGGLLLRIRCDPLRNLIETKNTRPGCGGLYRYDRD